MDLKKAFDVVSHEILLKKLRKFGINNKELDWFASYLKNRKQKVDIGGTFSNETTINISVLQGTTLGPILFLCFINDLFYSTTLLTYLFADDTSCLASHSNLHSLIEYVNIEMQKLANWFLSNKMALNINKTKFIIFRTKGKKIDSNVARVFINTNEIGSYNDPNKIFELERVYSTHPNIENQSYKLLGVYLDEYLTFDKHINVLCAKLSKANFCIRRINQKISTKALRCLYFAMFHSHLLYCINIYSCTSAKNIKKITVLQKKAIRLINKEKNNTHTEQLFQKSLILPFEKLILQSKLTFMHSICYSYAPQTFLNTFPINNNVNVYNLRTRAMYLVPFIRIEQFRKFPLYSFTSAWNQAGDVTFQTNKYTFQNSLKNLLLFDNFDGQRLYQVPE